jgi:PAS domain S-box-containing protein
VNDQHQADAPGGEVERLRQESADLRDEVSRLREALTGVAAGVASGTASGTEQVHAAAFHAQEHAPGRARLVVVSAPGGDARALDADLASRRAALLVGEDRLRAIVESAVDYAIITADFQDRITSWNKGATKLLGWEEADVLGRPCRLIFTPEDCAAGVPQAEMRKALEEGRATDERWHIRRDGTRFFAMGELLPLHDGELFGYLKILRDCTEQRRAEDALRESEERYRLIVESALDYAIFTTDLKGRITSWNRGAREVLGWDESEALGRPNVILYTPEDHLAGVPEAEMAEALAAGHAEHDRWHLRADGSRIWGTEVVTPLRDGDGEAHGFLKILRDRTAQKREEEQRRLLLAELNHRVKNTLAIVQSLVTQTARGAASVDALRGSLEARLEALATAHDLLTREGWQGADLGDVVRATLAPYAGESARIQVGGPELHLTPNAALVLNMALHELATNAAKYGALSAPEGWVEVSWRLDQPGDAPGATLDLLWRERGGPPVPPAPARGFGTRLIESTVTYQLGGDARLAFAPDGVECWFQLPLSSKLVRA